VYVGSFALLLDGHNLQNKDRGRKDLKSWNPNPECANHGV
jgi:hypothetical protein